MVSRRSFLMGSFAASVTLVACDRTGPGDGVSATTPDSAVPDSGMSAPTVDSTSLPPIAEPWAGAEFAELDHFLADTATEAFRIVERGSVVHEWYRTDSGYTRDIASAQKSVLSLLVGRAVADGLFTLDTNVDSVLGTTWTPGGRSDEVTVRHLLTMTSGLDDRLAVIAAPGEAWRYSGAFAMLFDVLTTTSGRDLDNLAREWLFDPAGATTARFYERPRQGYAPIGLRATVTDLTAIGQTVLDGTQPGLSPDWLSASFTPSQTYNPSYGYLWWLNGQESFMLPGPGRSRPGPLIPSAPDDLVAALGKDDQKLYVLRELQLCVSRLGAEADPTGRAALSSFDERLWSMLVDLRSA